MQRFALAVGLLTFAGCSETGEECLDPQLPAWEDLDGDGFGGRSVGFVCDLGEGQVGQPLDCDDEDPQVHPDATESCNQADDDCDGLVDEDAGRILLYQDSDNDGFGIQFPAKFFCQIPSEGWQTDFGDCDDTNPNINPGATEVCNDGIDDDCDGLADDVDDSVDPFSQGVFFVDADGDGFGDPLTATISCARPEALIVVGGDCDDRRSAINPDGIEICNGFDDDCDDLIDGADPDLDDPDVALVQPLDADGDGFGHPTLDQFFCPGEAPTTNNRDDCDDNDPLLTEASRWSPDNDGDGYGNGNPVSPTRTCIAPQPDTAPDAIGVDCNDVNPAINPGEIDACADGLDNNCDGFQTGACQRLGAIAVASGPPAPLNPPALSCLEVCAAQFGQTPEHYQCSTDAFTIDNRAFVDGSLDPSGCTDPVSESFKLEDPGVGGYFCATPGCSYSAWVSDNPECVASTNFCWTR